MEDDMVADAALWVIFTAALALIACGCRYTRSAPQVAEDPYDRNLDRAA